MLGVIDGHAMYIVVMQLFSYSCYCISLNASGVGHRCRIGRGVVAP